jgi:hypothetical protein
MNRTPPQLILLCALALAVIIPASAQTGTAFTKYAIAFPGNRTEVWSPNGLYGVKNVESTKKQLISGEAQNHLFF